MSTRQAVSEVSFEGVSVDGFRHGPGIVETDFYTYDGEFVHGNKHGDGVLTWSDGRQYRGQFIDDCFHGEAVMLWPDGRRYQGQYANDKKHGVGSMTWGDGRRYAGQWVEGRREGTATYTNARGETRFGKWTVDVPVQWDFAPGDHVTSLPANPEHPHVSCKLHRANAAGCSTSPQTYGLSSSGSSATARSSGCATSYCASFASVERCFPQVPSETEVEDNIRLPTLLCSLREAKPAGDPPLQLPPVPLFGKVLHAGTGTTDCSSNLFGKVCRSKDFKNILEDGRACGRFRIERKRITKSTPPLKKLSFSKRPDSLLSLDNWRLPCAKRLQHIDHDIDRFLEALDDSGDASTALRNLLDLGGGKKNEARNVNWI